MGFIHTLEIITKFLIAVGVLLMLLYTALAIYDSLKFYKYKRRDKIESTVSDDWWIELGGTYEPVDSGTTVQDDYN